MARDGFWPVGYLEPGEALAVARAGGHVEMARIVALSHPVEALSPWRDCGGAFLPPAWWVGARTGNDRFPGVLLGGFSGRDGVFRLARDAGEMAVRRAAAKAGAALLPGNLGPRVESSREGRMGEVRAWVAEALFRGLPAGGSFDAAADGYLAAMGNWHSAVMGLVSGGMAGRSVRALGDMVDFVGAFHEAVARAEQASMGGVAGEGGGDGSGAPPASSL